MQAYEIQAFGIEHLKQVERPDPQPGRGEILVAMRSTSLNYRDYLTLIGEYNPRLKLPLIPLCDGAGEVIGVGEGVKRSRSATGWSAISPRNGFPENPPSINCAPVWGARSTAAWRNNESFRSTASLRFPII